MEKNYYLPPAEDSGGRSHDNRLNPISAFQKTIADAEEKPEEFDVSAVYDKTLNYVKWMIGPRRSDETSDAYKARVFAELLGKTNHDDDDRDRSGRCRWDDRDLLVLYAREAAESGRPEKARRSYLRLIAETGAADPAYWLLYGAFCARDGDRDEALACAGRAVALDGRDRFALFARAALLMTAADDSDRHGELDALLDALAAAHPRFAEGHALAAVHYSRMDMAGRADRSLSLAGRFAGDGDGDDDDRAADGADRLLRIGLDAVWRPVAGCDGGGVDPAVKCASLLCRLELVDLAATCLRRFAAARADPYHYAMAVAHYRRAEYAASADHLNSMACRRSAADDGGGDGGAWTLLAGHVDYAAGRYREAVVRYVGLSLAPHQDRYGLAYSRAAGHFAANGRYAEAAEAYRRACTAIPAPALMTRLAACLVAVDRCAEAERLLMGAVAADGEYDGDAWHQLAELYGTAGRDRMSDVCGRRASELGYESDLFRRLRKT